jgi:hypothetical protein
VLQFRFSPLRRKKGAWLFIKIAREAMPGEFRTLLCQPHLSRSLRAHNLIWFDGSQHLKAHANFCIPKEIMIMALKKAHSSLYVEACANSKSLMSISSF